MGVEGFAITLLVGAIAGWLAGQIMRGGGFGLLGNIVVGIVGALVAGYILSRIGLNIGGGLIAAVINATIGGVIIIFLIRLVKRA